jgi:hypothetical protein
MIRTYEALGVARFIATDLAAAMAAQIQERMNLAIVTS